MRVNVQMPEWRVVVLRHIEEENNHRFIITKNKNAERNFKIFSIL